MRNLASNLFVLVVFFCMICLCFGITPIQGVELLKYISGLLAQDLMSYQGLGFIGFVGISFWLLRKLPRPHHT